MEDIKLSCEDGKFKFRVVGILRYNDKFLVQKIQENKFYCFPGGHVELGEDTDSAIIREMKEELPFAVKIDKLFTVIQNFFSDDKGKLFHELGYYYILEPAEKIEQKDIIKFENDKGQIKRLEYKWITYEELRDAEDIRPALFKTILAKDYKVDKQIIVRE